MSSANHVPLRGEIPGSFALLLSDYLESLGLSPTDVIGNDTDDFASIHRETRVPVQKWRSWMTRAADSLDDPLLGLRVGSTITPASLGVMGYVLLSCPHLGAALQRLEKYQRLLYDVNPMQQGLDGGRLTLSWGTEYGRPGSLVDEAAISALVQFARDITDTEYRPERVCFVNSKPAIVEPYREFFGCEVDFDRSATQVVLPLAVLALPLRQPDSALLQVLETQADALLEKLPESNSIVADTRRMVAALARDGKASIDNVAAALHCSPRTLHRRLADNQRSFREVRDETLRQLADEYLTDPGLTLAEIALLLGYSEQSAFTRAYRRWTGITPLQRRQTS